MDKVQFQPQNPYALFSPDQWSNAFSLYNNAALPWPSRYVGWPTDAMGNPIQSPPGLTVNSTPAPPAAAAPSAANPGQWAFNNSLLNSMGMAASRGGGPSPQMSDVVNMRAQNDALYGVNSLAYRMGQGANPTAPSQQPASGGSAAPSYDQVLSMLANPGKVTTPGATVPATSSSAQPGAMNLSQFLSNWSPAQSGPGAGFQQGFAKALRGMGY